MTYPQLTDPPQSNVYIIDSQCQPGTYSQPVNQGMSPADPPVRPQYQSSQYFAYDNITAAQPGNFEANRTSLYPDTPPPPYPGI